MAQTNMEILTDACDSVETYPPTDQIVSTMQGGALNRLIARSCDSSGLLHHVAREVYALVTYARSLQNRIVQLELDLAAARKSSVVAASGAEPSGALVVSKSVQKRHAIQKGN